MNSIQIASLLVCAVGTNAYFATLFNAVSSVHRSKRDTTGSCDICMKNLAEISDERLQKYNPNEPKLAVCRAYTPEMVKDVCIIRDEYSKCLDGCTGDQNSIAKALLKAFHICDERFSNFPKHYPCISSTCNDVDGQCGYKCKDSQDSAKEALEKLKNFGKTENPRIGEIQKMLGNICSYYGCYSQCLKKVLPGKCGQEATDLEIDIIKGQLSVGKEILTIFGLDALWPKVCSKIGDY